MYIKSRLSHVMCPKLCLILGTEGAAARNGITVNGSLLRNTAPRTTDSRGRPLTHFPSEDMTCLQDSWGSLPSTTHFRSTVDTTGRFKSHIYDIICGTSKCVNELGERLAKSATLLFASGFGIGVISWRITRRRSHSRWSFLYCWGWLENEKMLFC
jgi:hypothetical protein